MLAGDGSPAAKRALLPSELKKLLKAKRAKAGLSDSLLAHTPVPRTGPGACFLPSADQSASAANAARRPFATVSQNHLAAPPRQPAFQPVVKIVPRAPEKPKTSWALLKQLSILTGQPPGETAAHSQTLDFYKYPFPDLGADAQSKLSALIRSERPRSNTMEREHFRKLVDSWRRALLSLYQSLRGRRLEYFYYLQPDLVVLFRSAGSSGKESQQMTAVIARASASLVSLLRSEGIAFDERKDRELGEDRENRGDAGDMGAFQSESLDIDDQDLDEQENRDPREIKRTINQRLNHTRQSISVRRSMAPSSLTVRGEAAVHCLVDFLLNQKDGKSYVIAPELVASGPFLYGTLCRPEISVQGPLADGGGYQMKVSGLVLPSAAAALISEALPKDPAGTFKVATVHDERTDPFIAIQL